MEPEYITKKELAEQVPVLLKNATVAQYKWVYSYLKDLEEWPIVTDEVKYKKDKDILVPGGGVWAGEEKCPFQ